MFQIQIIDIQYHDHHDSPYLSRKQLQMHKDLAATIEQDNNAVLIICNMRTPTETSFNFHCITEIGTMKAVDTLENNSSSGHDMAYLTK